MILTTLLCANVNTDRCLIATNRVIARLTGFLAKTSNCLIPAGSAPCKAFLKKKQNEHGKHGKHGRRNGDCLARPYFFAKFRLNRALVIELNFARTTRLEY